MVMGGFRKFVRSVELPADVPFSICIASSNGGVVRGVSLEILNLASISGTQLSQETPSLSTSSFGKY